MVLILPPKKLQLNICTEDYRSGHNEAVLKTVCLYGHEGSNPPSSAKQKSILARECFFVLYKRILGDSNAEKKQHSALFLNGDRRFLQSINEVFLLLALQKSRATSPILRQNRKASARRSGKLAVKLNLAITVS